MITIANSAGFCFGVRRATDTVEKLMRENPFGSVFTLGALIHNEQYIDYLKRGGVSVISAENIDEMFERAKSGETITIVIRTHGIEKNISGKLLNYQKECENFRVIDCTCPFVKKIQKIANDNSEKDDFFILIGKEDHPEVMSILSYIKNSGKVLSGSCELLGFLKSTDLSDRNVKMAAQTTQSLSEWGKCQEIIKKYCTNIKIFDTICNVTEERQTEAKAICEKSDTMIVIGGYESSNTSKLYEVCKRYCPNTYWIQSKAEIPFQDIGCEKNIGITAGASTPDSLIQEVKTFMETIKEENFSELYEESKKTEKSKIHTGAKVTGTVESISENEIRLDLGAKVTGTIARSEITDDNDVKLSDLFKIGDEVEASVLKVSDGDGLAELSKKKVDGQKNWVKIVEYAKTNETVEGKIVEAVKGGLVAVVDSVRVFIPASMTGAGRDEDLSKFVGTVRKLKINEAKEDHHKVIGSIKAVLREEKKAKEEEFWNGIEEGKVYEGPVKSVTSYGAFVDLGGVDGLVHITELSWKRIKNPTEVVNVGDVIKVFIKSFDKENKKISLGYKTEEENPWNIFKSKYSVGDTADVKIVGITTFGAFAEIVPGVDGLIHISQIADQKIDSVANILKVGEIHQAKIIEVDEEKHKVSLSMRALLPESEQKAEKEENTEEEPVKEQEEKIEE